MKEKIMTDPHFRINYNLINDFSDATFEVTNEGIQTLFSWLKTRNSSERKSALLTATPDQVARILLFSKRHQGALPMQINIFSTLKSAINWVDLPSEKETEIKNILEELKASVS